MDNLLYSLNSVVPLFAVILLGMLLRRTGLINQSFIDVGTKIGFKVALPCLLFSQIYGADLSQGIDPLLFWFALLSVLAVTALLCLFTPLFLRDRARCGATIQAIFRGNFAILGVPLAINMFGEQGATPTALLLPLTIPLYNILAVVVLVLFEPRTGERTDPNFKRILLGILTNPLILSVLLALPFAFFRLTLPLMLTKSIDSVASIATPIALLCLGAQFEWKNARGNLKITLPATLVKLVLIPALTITLAALLGLRGGNLGAVFILYMAPSAVSSYIMAKNMKSDAQLAAQMILWTTLLSLLTMFLGIWLLRTLGLI